MSRNQDPSPSALAIIREKLRHGCYPPGAALTISDLAQEMRLSPTPVREALAHLAGEGLVVERRGLGYFAELLDAQGLVELYDLHHLLVAAALVRPRRWTPDGPGPAMHGAAGTPGAADATEALFDAIVSAAGDTTLRAAHRRVADRLAAVRRVEPWVIGDPVVELAQLADHFARGDTDGLLVSTADYHARRAAAAADLIAALRSKVAV